MNAPPTATASRMAALLGLRVFCQLLRRGNSCPIARSSCSRRTCSEGRFWYPGNAVAGRRPWPVITTIGTKTTMTMTTMSHGILACGVAGYTGSIIVVIGICVPAFVVTGELVTT